VRKQGKKMNICSSCERPHDAHSRSCGLCHKSFCRHCKRVELVKVGAKEWMHATCLANVSSPSRQRVGRQPRREGKTVIIVRHGQAVHNTFRPFNFAVRDPPLTEKGEKQASKLAGLDCFEGVQLYACSPLRRAIQTMMRFKDRKTPVFLHPCLQEFGPLGAVPCDKGSPVEEVLEWLGDDVSCKIDSTLLVRKWWKVTAGCSFKDEAKSRASAFMSWLLSRPERVVCLVGHGRTLQRLTTNKNQDKSSNPRLSNCEVRVFNLNEKGIWSVGDISSMKATDKKNKNSTTTTTTTGKCIMTDDSSLGDLSTWVDCIENEEESKSDEDEENVVVPSKNNGGNDRTRLMSSLVELRDMDLNSLDDKKIRNVMSNLQSILKSNSLHSFLRSSDKIKTMRPDCLGCASVKFDSHFRFCADCGVGPYCMVCRSKFMKRRGRKMWGCRICSVTQLGIDRPWLKFSTS